MQQELLRRFQESEINKADIPEVLTISNWIGGFARTWKRAMAEPNIYEREQENAALQHCIEREIFESNFLSPINCGLKEGGLKVLDVG
ncbi:hypothetical protein C2G38_2201295 [Gigaspora rosea]|uniref:Uncharacterized protein n=1 Tax=Gigaspora rosea TaxID=44941 RepID=A0A397UU11_9GLOM|nr:hypothetical protein C2G38_2201295 [Gigaspora rosea]